MQSRIIVGAAMSLACLVSGCFIESGDNSSEVFEGCLDTSDCGGAADYCYTVKWSDTTGSQWQGKMCSLDCSDEDECPTYSGCYALQEDPTGRRICYARCERDIDCHPGFACYIAEVDGGGIDHICMPR